MNYDTASDEYVDPSGKRVSAAAARIAVLDSKPIETEVTVSVAKTRTLVVTDAASYAAAGEHLRGYKALIDRITGYFADDVERAHKLWKSLTSKRKAALDSVEAESNRLRGERQNWVAEQERLQRQAEQQAALAAKRDEEERLTAEAALLIDQGQPELAEAVLEQAITAPAPVVVLPSFVPKVQGITPVEAYDFRIINEDLIPRAFMTPDLKKIRGVVQSMKGAARIPGVGVFRADYERVRARG